MFLVELKQISLVFILNWIDYDGKFKLLISNGLLHKSQQLNVETNVKIRKNLKKKPITSTNFLNFDKTKSFIITNLYQ